MWIKYNANPLNKQVGDCVIRSISKFLEQDWDKTYWDIANKGYQLADMPSSNSVWHSYLQDLGLHRSSIPDTCPACYTVRDFCNDHPNGRFLLGSGDHVVTVISGNHYDTWDSGDTSPIVIFSP